MVACGRPNEDDGSISLGEFCPKCKHIHSSSKKTKRKVPTKKVVESSIVETNIDEETGLIESSCPPPTLSSSTVLPPVVSAPASSNYEVIQAVEACENMKPSPIFCDICSAKSNLATTSSTSNGDQDPKCTCRKENDNNSPPELEEIEEDEENDPFLTPDEEFPPAEDCISMKELPSPRDEEEEEDFPSGGIFNVFSSLKRKKKKKKSKTPGGAVRIAQEESSKKQQQYTSVPTEEDDEDNLPNPTSDGDQKLTKDSPISEYNSGPIYIRSRAIDLRKLEKYLEKNRHKLTRSQSCDLENIQKKKFRVNVPFRVTKDGTKVFFVCDLSTYYTFFYVFIFWHLSIISHEYRNAKAL